MSFEFLLLQVLNGLHHGLLLFLVAGGLSLIFGLLGVVNLAHGSFYMFGAWLAWWASGVFGSYWLALPVLLVLVALGAFGLERALFRYIYDKPHLVHVLLTYGLVLLLDEARSLLWDDDVHGLEAPPPFARSLELGEDLPDYPVWRLVVSGFCLLLALGLWWLSSRTRFGAAVRAGVERREMAEGLGIDTPRLFLLVFVLGATLAGLAGALATPIASVYPGLDAQVLILSFVVVVVGGIGSLSGAFFAALVIGVADTLARDLVPAFAGVAVYLLMFAALVWRPEGVLAKRN